MIKTIDNSFKKKVNDLHGKKIEITGVNEDESFKLDIINHYCGHKYSVIKRLLLRPKVGCMICAGLKRRKDPEEYKAQFLKDYNGEYVLTGEYVTNRTKITIKHSKCGYEQTITPHAFNLLESKCPNCAPRNSRGERQIESYLESHCLSHITEKKFIDCKDKRMLPFDFLIEGKLLIEFDGGHHFKPVNFGERKATKALDRFNTVVRHDTIKNNYCVEKNIPLIRIPYWEFHNIEKIVNFYLINYNIIDGDINDFSYKLRRYYTRFLVDKNWKRKRKTMIEDHEKTLLKKKKREEK